jgi:type II secretory ATPase GspE/PulE/Tfp pilus assembly ATPase PilB-like protein
LRLRRGGDDQVAGSKRKQDEALPSPKVHNFEVVQEWSGNFIVLGTTGSGKTTLIK